MKVARPWTGSPFSTVLWTEHQELKQLPCLDPKTSLAFWFAVGLSVTVTITRFLLADPKGIDPFLDKGASTTVPMMVALLAASIAIGFKQYRYYYGGPSQKDGLFVERLRQANWAEASLDVLLSLQGGVITGLAFLPTWWFLGLGVYSALVLLRCHVTLRRGRYFRRLGSPRSLAFIPKTLTDTHNALHVGQVLAGWVFSHAVLAVLGSWIWWYLTGQPEVLAFWLLLGGYFLLFFKLLRPLSYAVGRRLLGLYGVVA